MSSIRLQAVGDITLRTSGASDPFALARDVFDGDAVLFGNLETALSDGNAKREKAYLFHAPPDAARHLADAGFDIVSTANNHILDTGAEALERTLAALDKYDIAHAGAGLRAEPPAPAMVRRHGVALGFLAYCSEGIELSGVFVNGMDPDRMTTDVRQMRERCDVVIVSLHWGVERVYYPSPEQIAVARSLIDAGACVVLGHHPHVVQGIETYRDGLIAYSLGNFQFCTARPESNKSIALSMTIEKGRVASHDYVPITINRAGQPAPMEPEDAVEMRRMVDSISDVLSANTITTTWWFEQIAYAYLGENLSAFWIRIRRYGVRHAVHCLRWLVSPFVLRCYMGLVRKAFRRHE